ncbi:MAG: hypothetical protein FWC62_01845 [Firmicutes bacterium]|nr:hypothetical protein [Bacillota bacterium]
MNLSKPLSLVLIEDDVSECVKFKDCVNRRGDTVFVGMTSSSFEGINLVKNHLPEGVVLDLELHKGSGSGLQFLESLSETRLGLRPIVVVTTNAASNVVYNAVHASGADMVFYKGQPDYSPDMVINTLQVLRKSLLSAQMGQRLPGDMRSIESPAELEARIQDRIDTELDLIGLSPRLRGRQYLQEAIFLLLSVEKDYSESVIKQISATHKHTYTTITRAMQTAIDAAWQNSPIEDLQLHYSAKINYRTGVPSPTEFIYYYANKIRKTM